MRVNPYPGCYGSSITYSSNSKVCSSCEYNDGCKISSEKRSVMIGEYVFSKELAAKLRVKSEDVKVMMSRSIAKSNPKTEKQIAFIERVIKRYKKAGRLAKFIVKSGVDVKAALSIGENPYKAITTNVYVSEFCDLLLQGKASREFIKREFVNKFGWSNTTANSHLLVCVHTFDELGIITEDNGMYNLSGVIDD